MLPIPAARWTMRMIWLQVEQEQGKHTHCQPGMVSLIIKDARKRCASGLRAVPHPQYQGAMRPFAVRQICEWLS